MIPCKIIEALFPYKTYPVPFLTACNHSDWLQYGTLCRTYSRVIYKSSFVNSIIHNSCLPVSTFQRGVRFGIGFNSLQPSSHHPFLFLVQDLLELDSNISLPLPAGWAVGVSSSGRRFYVSCTTSDAGGSSSGGRSSSSRNRARTTTWQHPIIAPRIPLGWERVEMRRGNCVYYRQ